MSNYLQEKYIKTMSLLDEQYCKDKLDKLEGSGYIVCSYKYAVNIEYKKRKRG